MAGDVQYKPTPHLMWLYTETPTQTLDSATWIETTRELQGLGWNVTLVAEGNPGPQNIRGVEVYCLRRPRIYLFGQLLFHLQFFMLLLRTWTRTDIVLLHEGSAFWLLPVLPLTRLLLGKGPQWVVDTRTLPMEQRATASLKTRLRWVANSISRALSDRIADGRLAITARMATSVGIPLEKLWGVWPSGVNWGAFANTNVMRQFPADNEPVRLVYLGSVAYERNLMGLARAVESVNRGQAKFTLTIIGKGEYVEALRAFAQSTDGRVEVLDPIPYEQVPAKLAQFHIGVLPFPDEEKFRVSSPIKLFEYMASGMPILATKIPCHTDVTGLNPPYVFWAADGNEQALVDCLLEIDPVRASLCERGEVAREAARACTWAESARKLSDALQARLLQNSNQVDETSRHDRSSEGEQPALHVGVILSMKKGMEHFVYRELRAVTFQGVSVTLFPTKYRAGLYNPPPEWKVVRRTTSSVLISQAIHLLHTPRQYWRTLKIAHQYRAYVDFMLAWHYSRTMREVDVIYAIFGDHKFFVGYFAKLILQKPLVVTIHAYELYQNPNPALFNEALRICDQVVTVTEYNRDILIQRYSVDPAKLHVVRIGVDLEDYCWSEKFVILIVAFFTPTKGHEILLRALKKLEQPDIELWVVGDKGSDEESIDVRRLAHEIGVENQVAFFGSLSGNALKAMYRLCDAFCLPCHVHPNGSLEGFPTVIAEAMAFSKPVISTHHTEIPHVLDRVLVPEKDVDALAEAIRRVYNSDVLRDDLGSENHKKAEALFSSRNHRQLVDVLCRSIPIREAVIREGERA